MLRRIFLLLALAGSASLYAQEAHLTPGPRLFTLETQLPDAAPLDLVLPRLEESTGSPGLKRESKLGLHLPARESVADHALALQEVRYRMGGQSPSHGFDCSGFVKYVFRQALGLELIGNAATLAKQGRTILKSELKMGDLVFFNTRNKPMSHVGLYLGDGEFIHAAGTGKGVQISNMAQPYFAKRYQGARTLFH